MFWQGQNRGKRVFGACNWHELKMMNSGSLVSCGTVKTDRRFGSHIHNWLKGNKKYWDKKEETGWSNCNFGISRLSL